MIASIPKMNIVPAMFRGYVYFTREGRFLSGLRYHLISIVNPGEG
jgi:hypothetical protein